MIGLNPDIRILWLMKAGTQAQARVGDVAETIEENPVFRAAFPDVVPNKARGWSKVSLYVKRGRQGPDPTLMGCGINGPYQGFHFDVIIMDDPTNQEDVQSPSTMESQRRKLRGVIPDRLVDGGRFVAIMTRWGEDDLVPTFREQGFTVITMPVMSEKYPWGPTISPIRFPVDRCEQLRREKTDAIFDLTYMCDPTAVEGGIIRREYLRYWTRFPKLPNEVGIPENGTVSIMAVDLAASQKTWADYTVIGTGLVELKTRKCYVTDLWAKKATEKEVEDELVKRARGTARLGWIGVETKGFQLTFLQRMRRLYKLPFRELPYRTKKQATLLARGIDNDKTSRAFSIANKFNSNQLYLPSGSNYLDGVSLSTELVSFPFAKHDDRLDVIAFLSGMADTYSGRRGRVHMGRA